MLAGDLSTMSLADVLQWVDATRRRAWVRVEASDGRSAWLVTEERAVVAGAPPVKQGRLSSDEQDGAPGPGRRAVAVEALLDLFLVTEGRFELRPESPVPEGGVPLDLPLAFLLMEGLRLLDEWPRIRDTYPDDAARIGATDTFVEQELDPIDAAIRDLAEEAPGLAEARLVLGVSRPTLLRRVDRLRQRGLVDVEGTPHGPDLGRSIVDQAELLLRQEQYAEAAHVFRTLLASDPSDARVIVLLREAERQQLHALYRELRRTDVVTVAPDADLEALEGTDRAVVDQLTRPRPVGVLTLVSPLREIETLTTLKRLAARGVVSVEGCD